MTATFHLGIEDMEPGNWVAWIFEFPGCYSRSSNREAAIKLAPDAIKSLTKKLRQAGLLTFEMPLDFNVITAEEFRAFPSSADYLVNAFFDHDKIPLSGFDVIYGAGILGLNRKELLSIVVDLPQAILDRHLEGEVQKTIRGILRHIGTAEWWYWDRMGLAFPREKRPDDIFELLDKIRGFTIERLPDLLGNTQLTTCSGEAWSARKLLRRAIWHEHVHTAQIARYLKSL